MKLDRDTLILTSWCASNDAAAQEIFPQLVASNPNVDDVAWRAMIDTLNAPRLARILTMARPRHGVAPLDHSQLVVDAEVHWNGAKIGEIFRYYKTAQPYEAQARVACDLFYDRFVEFVAEKYRAVALAHSDFDVELFVPNTKSFDLALVWNEFVDDVFSAQALQKTFASLVNSIKMTDKGFSALDVPIVNQTQARFLAAFYLANIESLRKGDKKREREIAGLEQELDESVSERDQERLTKKIAKLTGELEQRKKRYGAFYERVDALGTELPDWMGHVQSLERASFTPLAGIQVSKAGGKIGKAVTHLEQLANMGNDDYFQIPMLLMSETVVPETRTAGDAGGKFCYACGQPLKRGQPIFSANKFIFSSPSQRLQSGGGQMQPKVCGTCAAVSFVSPIKLGSGRLVLRMREHVQSESNNGQTQSRYLMQDQLRMFVLGEMNIVAGKYVILQARETISGKLVSDRLGGLQYALYKVGSTFLPEVFQRYDIEAFIEESSVVLTNRHLAWIHQLGEIFSLARSEWKDKGQFAAFGRGIRYIQHEEVIFAVYELLGSGLAQIPLDDVKGNQLDKLYAAQVRWLMNDNMNERAQFYKDVAAMTGLLYPFCDYVRGEVRKAGGNERIEVRKVIERCDDPFQVDYTVAGNTGSEMATFFRTADMHFCFDELKAFLQGSLELEVAGREATTDKGQETLRLYFDDVAKAYTYLFGERYKTPKDQREFTYALKLSLYARFPEYIQSQKQGDK